MPRVMTVYALDRLYGGPEEGGWWFDTGTVVLTRELTASETEDGVRAELATQYPEGTKYRFSMRPQGRDYRIDIDDEPGTDFPEFYPHYE